MCDKSFPQISQKAFYLGLNIMYVHFIPTQLGPLLIDCYKTTWGCCNKTWLVCIETVSPEDTLCDTVQVPSGADDMQLI